MPCKAEKLNIQLVSSFADFYGMNCKNILASLNWCGVRFSYEELNFFNQMSQGKSLTEWLPLLQDSKAQNYWQNSDWLSQFEKEHIWLNKLKAELLAPWEPSYPEALRSLKSPPFLTVLGSVGSLSQPSLAVVGSRNPSPLALKWMREDFSQFILENNLVIISGGARGIDQEAHRISIARKQPTICFLPSGLAKVYPPEIFKWFEYIISHHGAVVSQFSPFTQIFKSHFHKRNELIATMSLATFVVEARLRSGSLMTAEKAISQGREVATLPCSPNLDTGRGNLKLLIEGAQLIRDAEDLKVFWQRNYLGPLGSSFMQLEDGKN